MSWIYILVICLAIYYIVARYLEKSFENFDPSLVPVSSIVTLAKVAQKLVDGGGTLTNPGNLQIGVPGVGTTGNLRVTGTTTLDGATTLGSTLTVNGISNLVGATTVYGALSAKQNLKVTGRTDISFDGGLNTLAMVTKSTGEAEIHCNNLGYKNTNGLSGTIVTIDGELKVNGKLTGGNIYLTNGYSGGLSTATNAEISSDNGAYSRVMILGNTSNNDKTNPTGRRRIGMWDDVAVNGNLNVTGTVTIPGNVVIGGTAATALQIKPRSIGTGVTASNTYHIYSDIGTKLQIYCTDTLRDILSIDNEGGTRYGSNYPTVVRKYSGACNGTIITINFPRCAYKYDFCILSNDTNGYSAQIGVMSAAGTARNLLMYGDPQIRAPHSTTQLAFQTFGAGNGNWFLTLDCYLF